MRPGAAHRSSFRHELVLHGSTAELLEFAVPFAHEGIAAGESTLLLVRPEIRVVVQREQHRAVGVWVARIERDHLLIGPQ